MTKQEAKNRVIELYSEYQKLNERRSKLLVELDDIKYNIDLGISEAQRLTEEFSGTE